MALEFGPAKGYLATAIVLGVILLVASMAHFALGVLGWILIAAIIVLMVVWTLKALEIM